MDAIKNLVAGADPVGPNPTEADGEKALQLMFARPEVFADRVPKDIPTLAERRQRRNRVLGLSVLATAAATVGVLVSINLGPLTAAPAPANTLAAVPTASASPTATAAPETTQPASPPAVQAPIATSAPVPSSPAPAVPATQRFASAAAGISFNVPVGWSAAEVPAGAPGYPAIGIDVVDATGKKVASLNYGVGGGRGGACGPETITTTELDSAQYSGTWTRPDVRFAYRVLDKTAVGGGFTYQTGLVDADTGRQLGSCLMYSGVSGAPRGTLTFGDRSWNEQGEPSFSSMAEAQAYMATAEYSNLKAMVLSLSIAP